MTDFFYKCKHNNEIIEGYINAKSIADASKKLAAKNYTVLEIKQKDNFKNISGLTINNTPFTIKEKKDFYSSLAKQYKSGVAFLEIFSNIISTGSTQNVKGLAFKIMKKLQKGDSIEDVFNCFSSYIGKTEAALIVAGNSSGTLIKILEKITKQIKEEENIIISLKSKTVTPLITIGILIICLQIAFFFILPIFNQIAEGMDINLKSAIITALTKITICTSILAVIIIKTLKSKALIRFLSKILFKTKKLKEILKDYYFSNFFTTLSLAQEAGLTPYEAIKLSKEVILDENTRNKLNDTQKMLKNGCDISTAYAVASIFNDYTISQIDSNETSGNLAEAFEDISQDYKNEFNQKVDVLVKLFEPTLIIVVAMIVAPVIGHVLFKYYETIFKAFG